MLQVVANCSRVVSMVYNDARQLRATWSRHSRAQEF
jgi:hypothetical protein